MCLLIAHEERKNEYESLILKTYKLINSPVPEMTLYNFYCFILKENRSSSCWCFHWNSCGVSISHKYRFTERLKKPPPPFLIISHFPIMTSLFYTHPPPNKSKLESWTSGEYNGSLLWIILFCASLQYFIETFPRKKSSRMISFGVKSNWQYVTSWFWWARFSSRKALKTKEQTKGYWKINACLWN